MSAEIREPEVLVHAAVTEYARATWAGLELVVSSWEIVAVDDMFLIFQVPLTGDSAGMRQSRHVSHSADLAAGAWFRWTGCTVSRHWMGA